MAGSGYLSFLRLMLPYGIGLAVIALIGALLSAGYRPVPSAGWQTIRPPHEVSCLALQGNRLWAGGQDGLVCLNTATGMVLAENRIPVLQGVRALWADADGTLWIGHENGLGLLNFQGYRNYTVKDGQPDSVPA